jgi:hypothetical protein
MDEVEKRKERILNWIRSPYNFLLLAILVATSVFRYYFLFKTKNQALWYDEALYLMLGRSYAGIKPAFYASGRDYFVSMVWSLLIKLGLGEFALRFITVAIGIITLLFFYLLIAKLANKKVGLIALAFAAFFYEPIFWSLRLDIGTYSIFFIFASFLAFAKGLETKKLSFYLAASGLAVFGFLSHAPGILIILFYLVYVPIYSHFKFYKSKKFWLCLGFFFLLLSPFIAYNLISKGEIYPRYQSGWFERDAQVNPISESFIYLTTIPGLIGLIPFIALLLGLFISLEFLIGLDTFLKKGFSKKDLNIIFILLFGLISLALGMQSLIVNGGGYYEPRYVLPLYFSCFVFAAMGIDRISEEIKKYSKSLSIFFIIILISFATYPQINNATTLINVKKESYQGIMQAGLWLRDNAGPEDHVITFEHAQIIYYSGHDASSMVSASAIREKIINKNARYLIMWAGGNPDSLNGLNEFLLENREHVEPVAAFPVQASQPTTAIYEVKESFFNTSLTSNPGLS